MNKVAKFAAVTSLVLAVPTFATAESAGVGVGAEVGGGAEVGAGIGGAGVGAGVGAEVGAGAGIGLSGEDRERGASLGASARSGAGAALDANADRPRDPVTRALDRVFDGLFNGVGPRAAVAGQQVASTQAAVRDVTPNGQRSVEALLSAIDRTGATAGDIARMDSLGEISVVGIGEVASVDTLTAVTTAAEARINDIANLRAAVEGNAELRAELAAQGIRSEDIVAAHLDARNSLTVYTATAG